MGGLGGAGQMGVGRACLDMSDNDTDFTLLQEELNATISRPLRPNFATGPIFDQLWGPTAPKR